uniref:Uncharacterized protein n=1 Tax=Mycobacterium sp. (strain JLS) TaxID=164757 RepID=A0A5Q5CDF9_MYCSJ
MTSVTNPTVWISTSTGELTFDADKPAGPWHYAGTIDTAHETASFEHIQVQLGRRNTATHAPEFYLSGDPESAWVQEAKADPRDRPRFWIAIEPFGNPRIQYTDGTTKKYFVSTEQAAVVAAMRRRAPEPHPGLRVKPVMIGIRLKQSAAGLFTTVTQPRDDNSSQNTDTTG